MQFCYGFSFVNGFFNIICSRDDGEGTMLYTASHEVVHFIKENAPEHYDALEALVTKALIEGGYSIETLLEDQKNKLIEAEKQRLIADGVDPNTMSAEAFENLARERIGETNLENIAREEMIAEACQSFLASKSAVAEIKALKTKNKGLWSALKKFFTSWFNKINKIYKTVPPDSEEAKYIADMRKAVKPIRDAFMEGAVAAGKKTKTNTIKKTTEKMVKSKARVTSEEDTAYLDAVKRGDMETAQKLVDEAAKANGYTVRAYHGRTADFTVFDKNKIGSGATLFASQGKGFYFTANREVADKYASRSKDTGNVLDAFLKISKPFVFTDKSNAEVNKLLNSFAETIGSSFNVSEYSNWVDFEKRTGAVLSRIVKNNGESFTSFLEKKGYDGIVYTSVNYDTMQSDLTYIVFNSEQIKSADPVTYDDNGNVIPLSERFNENNKDIRHKARSVDKYTEKEYNSFGWVRANDVLSAFENERLRSMFADAKTNQSKPPKSKAGEYMIAVGEDVDNKIAYMQGEIDNPIITRVLTIDEYDETEIDKARRNIYDLERRGIQQETKGVFRLYRKTDFGSYATYERNVKENERNNIQLGADRGTGSRTAQKVKEILFDDEGNEVSRTIRSKSRTRTYSQGQAAVMKANLSHQKVYTKSTAMKFVKAVAPGIKTKAFDELSNELWIGLNTYTSLEDKQAFAKDMADMLVERMLVDTEVKNAKWDEAVEKIAYIKHGINSIKFRAEDLPDLEHVLDKKGLASLRARWGYKSSSKEGIQRRPYGLDEFITDLSREMPGMSYLADMHTTEAMIEVDKVYVELDASKRNMRTLRLSSLGKNPLSLRQTKKPPDWVALFGGEEGIRTLETVLGFTRFPVVRLRPTRPSLHATSIL